MRPKFCPCGGRSVPGLITGIALCTKHFNALQYEQGDSHKEALVMLGKCKEPGFDPYERNRNEQAR